MRARPVVAIDGPSGAGKSTVARGLARKLGFALVDTGALYRAVAWLARSEAVDWQDGPSLGRLAAAHRFAFDPEGALSVDGQPVGDRIRTPEMSLGASAVASQPDLRQALLAVQRELGRAGGVVLEGRDIGTVVFPDAEVKFFLDASTRVRALRRFRELEAKGQTVTLEQVEEEQAQRDQQDREREVSPLRQAEDALSVACDGLTADEVIEVMAAEVRARFPLI